VRLWGGYTGTSATRAAAATDSRPFRNGRELTHGARTDDELGTCAADQGATVGFDAMTSAEVIDRTLMGIHGGGRSIGPRRYRNDKGRDGLGMALLGKYR
jgi:hypothetical protein